MFVSVATTRAQSITNMAYALEHPLTMALSVSTTYSLLG